MTARIHSLLGAASLGIMAAAAAVAPTSAMAQQAASIDLPAMPLADALRAIGERTGTPVDFDPDAVRGVTSQPVNGAIGADAAVHAAIRGANLAVLPDENGGLTVVNGIVVRARRDEAETSVLVRQTSTSDRNGLSLRDQPRNTQVISAKTIEEQQALNITDILRNAGGVSAQLNNPNSGASYTVRGFAASGLVNGLSTGSQYGVNAGADQPVANIERVEVLKGPDALLAGFDNLGGNVNVVTKKPSADPRLAVSLDVGSFGLVRGVIDGNTAITDDGKLSARVIASKQTMDHNYGGYTGNDDALFAPTLRFKDRLTDIIVGASLSESKSGIGAYTLFDRTTGEIVDRDPSIPIYSSDADLKANTARFYFDLTRQIVPGIEIVARGLHDDITLLAQAPALGYGRNGLTLAYSGSQQKGKTDAFDGFVRVTADIGDFLNAKFNVGYNYSSGTTVQRSGSDYIQIVNPPLGENTTVPVIPFPPLGDPLFESKGKQEAVYGQALLDFGMVKLIGGLRKNWFETSITFLIPGIPPGTPQKENGITPNAGVIVDATDWLSLYANYSRGEQAVFTQSLNGDILPNIETTNKEAGIKLDLFDERATINASYFDIQQDNTIAFGGPAIGFVSAPGQRGRGFDVNIAGQILPGWTVLGSYTHTNFKLLTVTSFQTDVARQPQDTYSLYTTYRTRLSDDLSGGFAAGLYGRSSSYADRLGQYVVPAARQVDVNAFVTVAGFDVNLGVRNVFDRRNYNTTSTDTYVPVDEPRNVRLSVTKRLF